MKAIKISLLSLMALIAAMLLKLMTAISLPLEKAILKGLRTLIKAASLTSFAG